MGGDIMLNFVDGDDNCDILLNIMNSLGEGVNIVNRDGILLYSNKLSGEYVDKRPEDMIGHHISQFYPQAALMNVLKTGKSIYFDNVVHDNGQIYEVKAHPIFCGVELIGGFAVFKDVTEINLLNKKLEELEMKMFSNEKDDIFSLIVGYDCSLRRTIQKAKRSVGALGGPRHSIITGESGTGKTMLARSIYLYAKDIGVVKKDAPFIEVNCAQYTNSDIAAMEVFGCNEGAYTGAKDKKGLFELADGGILFLDEAHTLDHYQNLLLKVIESGYIRRIGGTRDRKVDVIVISASTKNLHHVLVPELYQRLAQYELFLPPLRERTIREKEELLNTFIRKYEDDTKERYNIDLNVKFTSKVKSLLLEADYPRNIRQFRDIINASIDSAVPLIDPSLVKTSINTIVDIDNLPTLVDEIINTKVLDQKTSGEKVVEEIVRDANMVDDMIIELSNNGLGPRRIANILNERGIDIKYYQVAYRLKKQENETK